MRRALVVAALLAAGGGCKRSGSVTVAQTVADAAGASETSTAVMVPPSTPPLPKRPHTKPIPPTVATVCPKEMAPIPIGGCIDRWEASLAGGAKGGFDGTGTTLLPASEPGRPPLVDVSVAQAMRACENAKKHLCSEVEWRSACHNDNDLEFDDIFQYSYGRGYEPKRCNDWHASDQGKSGVRPTGTFARCVTPTGVFDLSNNAAELTATPDHLGAYPARGGSFNNVIVDSSCDEDDYKLKKTEHQRDVGFRCCAPGTPAAPTGGAAPTTSAAPTTGGR